MSLFANTAGIVPKIVIGMKSFVFCSGDYRRCPGYQSYVQDVGALKVAEVRWAGGTEPAE